MTDDALPKRTVEQLDRMADALDAFDALLLRLGLQGLQRVSKASADELLALEQTAHSAGLITLSRTVNALSTQITRALDRDPLFEMGAFRSTINRLWLLVRRTRARLAEGALPDDMLGLIGQARRSFALLDAPLDLQALGATGWVSDTGFVGVTIHFSAVDSNEVLQVSSARPTMYFGDDPQRLMRMPVNDELDLEVSALAHGAWRFTKAKKSSDGRLSLHRELELTPSAWRGGHAYDAFAAADWTALVERLRRAEVQPIGGDGPPLVYIEPAAVDPVRTDTKRGQATAEARDRHGAPLDVHVPLRRENNLLVDNLERIFGPGKGGRAPRPDGLFGRLSVADDRLRLMPWTAVYAEPIQLAARRGGTRHTVHLSLESLEGARR
ncbi:MAG: hypothetical protein KC620_05715 [Myxococcales bacterium]|nr:hypothetical protein [Myxococcales bacterium]